MEFLNPTALYGLLGLPLLLVPYLIRRKPRRVLFSSLLLFTEIGERVSAKPWGRLRLPPIFFLQLLLLALLILALGEPVFSVRPSRIAIVLDNSASMQALEDGRSRFQLAQQEAYNLLAGLGALGKIDVYRTVPRLEKTRAAALTPAEARGAIAELEALDMGSAPMDYDAVLNQMAGQQKYDRVYFITDQPVRGQGEMVRAISVGSAKDNLAVTSLQINRASLTNAQLNASVELTSYSSKDAKVRIVLRGVGTAIAAREVTIPAGKTAAAAFEGVPLRMYYEAEVESRDPFLLDNRRFALPPASTTLRILGVSPRPQALASLRAIPGISLDMVAPRDYPNTERSGYAMELFHLATPAALPDTPALFVLPPDANALVELGRPVSRPLVSSWREPHPLTRYVNFALFRPAYARPLRPEAAGETVVESAQGPLVFTAQQGGRRHVVLGFDPFPYLGRENLPMSVFTLNVLDWFFERAGTKGIVTGEPIAVSAARPGDVMITPRGEKLPVKAGMASFPRTFYQGIYQVTRGRAKELFAVNFQDASESDLRRVAPVELGGARGAGTTPSTLFSFWPHLLAASLLLLLLEWFVHPRPARYGTGAAQAQPFSRHA
jgi:hypothetical protein